MLDIPREQMRRRIAAENPWWEKPFKVPKPFSDWRPRPFIEHFYPLVKGRDVRRAVVLMGPRRVGKTVMIHHAIAKLLREGAKPKHICYFSVDHPLYNAFGLEDLLDLYGEAAGVDYNKAECFVFFDEIQYLRDWERHLKVLVDRYTPLKAVVSGSAAAALRLKSVESGAGRFTDFLLPPLSFHEFLFFRGEQDLTLSPAAKGKGGYEVPHIKKLNARFVDYLNYGGYPEALFSEEIRSDPARFIKSDVIDKVLLRDLPGLYGIQDVQELNSLFTTLAFNTGNEVSLEDLSKNSGVAKNTIKKYLEYLEAAFLIRVVHRLDQNARRFKRATHFKVYLTNPSLRAALFSPVGPDDPAMGGLVETAILANYFATSRTPYYARWKSGEVDVVFLTPKQKPRLVFEVKWTDRFFHSPDQLKGLLEFCHKHNLSAAFVTTQTCIGEKMQRSVRLDFVPASFLCYVSGEGPLKDPDLRLRLLPEETLPKIL